LNCSSLERGARNIRTVMNKNRSHVYFILVLLAHILVYLFKIDRDVFSFQEYGRHPHQTYTEQPLSKNAAHFRTNIFDFPQSCKSCVSEQSSIDHVSIWRSILLSYNSRVHHLLNLRKSSSVAATRVILILHKQNIYHKSSEDEELVYRFLNINDQTKLNA